MSDERNDDEDQPDGRETELLAELRRALGPDTPPEGLVERAAGLVALAEVDRELDELLREAAAQTVGVRGPADDARLVFEVADGSIACEIEIDGGTLGGRKLDGQVLSGRVATVELLGLGGPLDAAPVDDLGRFTFPNVPAGPSRLRLDDGSGRDLRTDWFLP